MKQTKSTRRYGLIGHPVKHSFSKAMHEAAFSHLGIDAAYELFEVKPEELEDFLLNRKDVTGFNITIPHKVRAREIFEDFLNSEPFDIGNHVEISGAINTVVRDKNKLFYANTDVKGFLSALEEDLELKAKDIKDKNVLIFGCGGAGRAIIAGLAGAGGSGNIYIYDPSESATDSAKEHFFKFSYLKKQVKFILQQEIKEVISNCTLLVNASPVGMKEGNAFVVEKKLLHKNLSVYDVVYNRETQLVKEAKEVGLNATGGLKMLLHQGAWAFRIWTGQEPPIDVMFDALQKELEKCRKS